MHHEETSFMLAVMLGISPGKAASLLDKHGGLLGLVDAETSLKGRLDAFSNLSDRLDGDRCWAFLKSREQTCNAPEATAKFFHAKIGKLDHEEVWIVGLNGVHVPIGFQRICSGGPSSAGVSVPQILGIVLRMNARSFILSHNHPSGDPAPSREDIDMTREVLRASDVVGVPMLDHVIVTRLAGKFSSLRQIGGIFDK